MTCCADCKYCRADKELAKVDPNPWICPLTGEQTDPENQCTHFEEEKE